MNQVKNQKENLRLAVLEMTRSEIFFVKMEEEDVGTKIFLPKGHKVAVEIEILEDRGENSLWKLDRQFYWVYPMQEDSIFRILMNKKYLK